MTHIPNLSLVTGATGFVGAAVARCLQEAGYPLRLAHRESANLRNFKGLGGERVVADLTQPASLDAAVAGCDAVFHVAADYRLWARDPAQLFATNVDGTMALLRAAARAGVGRFVYTSSVSTLKVEDGRLSTNPSTLVSKTWWARTNGPSFWLSVRCLRMRRRRIWKSLLSTRRRRSGQVMCDLRRQDCA